MKFAADSVGLHSLLAKLYISLGQKDCATQAAKEGLKRMYNLRIKKGELLEDRPLLFKDMEINFPSYFNSKLYMDAALVYAFVCDVAGSDEQKSKAYQNALNVIDERIFLKDIDRKKNDYGNKMILRLMSEKQVLAVTSKYPGVTLTGSERSAMFDHGWVSSETMQLIDRKMKEGKIDNPRIRQINK